MKKKTYLNIFCSTMAQLVTIISGLIVPRLLLGTFGSEANGLISSLTQFLNYISLVEGGLGSVVLAALYLPLAKKDDKKLSSILKSANRFFKQIAYIFVVYVVILGIIYPLIVESNFSRLYIASLTVILAIGLFIQYFFSITYKLLLQADQRMYVVQLLQIVTSLINLILVVALLHFFPSLHIVKLGSALIFVIQPIFYSSFVKQRYHLNKNIEPDKNALAQRWDCFGQNFAFFIHNNTDTVVLSIFTDLKIVSVYSVHFLIVSHLKSFFQSFSHAFAPMIGKAIAQKDFEKANSTLDTYEFLVSNVATIIFGCCIYLLPSFVLLYTHGITDVNYYQPLFSTIIILAEFVYCIRTPYNDVIYSAGKLRETAKSGYIEAAINIILSVALVIKFGLVGIAFGTLVGMTYRMFYFVWYISRNILYRAITKFVKRLGISSLILVLSPLVVNVLDTTGSPSVLLWIKNGAICLFTYGIVTLVINMLLDRKTTIKMLSRKKN